MGGAGVVGRAGQIKEKEGIAPKNQRLIYSGKSLDDSLTLKEYNIRPNFVLNLVLTEPE